MSTAAMLLELLRLHPHERATKAHRLRGYVDDIAGAVADTVAAGELSIEEGIEVMCFCATTLRDIADVNHPATGGHTMTSAPTKWTPGPWTIQEMPTRNVFLKRRHWAIGQIAPPRKGVGLAFGETAAVANLFAAAPELYEALVGVIRVADRKTDEFDRARAALAKARGESAET